MSLFCMRTREASWSSTRRQPMVTSIDVPGAASAAVQRLRARRLWVRGRTATVSVDPDTFVYSLAAFALRLGGGSVALTCGGVRFCSDRSCDRRLLSARRQRFDGAHESIERLWEAHDGNASCATMLTAIRYHNETDVVEWVTTLPTGADGTAREPTSLRHAYKLGTRSGASAAKVPCKTATEFPSFRMPPPAAAAAHRYISWNGCSLFGPGEHDSLHKWKGGLASGPLIILSRPSAGDGNATDASARGLTALVLGTSVSHKVGILSRDAERLIGGVQGMVQSLPANFSLAFATLAQRGVAAASIAWGAYLLQSHQSARLSLADDVLSAKLHYMTDGGSALCYCDFCAPTAKARAPVHAARAHTATARRLPVLS